MIKKLISLMLIVILLAFGLFLPDLIAKISDLRIETDPVYTVFCPAEEFSYIGTLEDKLRALTDYENMSVDYTKIYETEWNEYLLLSEQVKPLFPSLAGGKARTRSFTLSHKSVSVRFTYTETELHAENGSVRIITDPETEKILRLSVTNAREAIQNWEKTRKYDSEGFLSVTGIDAYALLRMFANINGFAEISDLTDGNSYGGSVSTVKADIREHPYSLSLTFSKDAGTIFYRLIQVENN